MKAVMPELSPMKDWGVHVESQNLQYVHLGIEEYNRVYTGLSDKIIEKMRPFFQPIGRSVVE